MVQSGADRICLDGLLHDGLDAVVAISEGVGAQAVIGSLPLRRTRDGLAWLDYRDGREGPLAEETLRLFENRTISEVMAVDWQHEGFPGSFDECLVDDPTLEGVPVIAFGGINDGALASRVLARPNVVAAAIGNFLSYREHAIQKVKDENRGNNVRPSQYKETE